MREGQTQQEAGEGSVREAASGSTQSSKDRATHTRSVGRLRAHLANSVPGRLAPRILKGGPVTVLCHLEWCPLTAALENFNHL